VSALEMLDTWLTSINKPQLLFTTTEKRDREKIHLPQAIFETGNIEAVTIFFKHLKQKTWGHPIDPSSFPFPTKEWPIETQIEGLNAWKQFCGSNWKQYILPLWQDVLNTNNIELVTQEITSEKLLTLLEKHPLEKTIVLLMQSTSTKQNKDILQQRIEEQANNISQSGFQGLPPFEAYLYTAMFCSPYQTDRPVYHNNKEYRIDTNHALLTVKSQVKDWSDWIGITRPNALQKFSRIMKPFEIERF
jgi:hypothetical protein